METPPNKTFGASRIAAIVLIAIAVAGLGYVRFGHDSKPVAVPSGAHAGQLEMHSCRYATESGKYAADCGTLVVPENRHNAHSRLIALPVTRIQAHSGHPGAPIFRLEGGPCITNTKFADASRFAGKHDVVLVGYRGVDGSSKLKCPEVVSALKHAGDFLGNKSLESYSSAFSSCANRLRSHGTDLAGYTVPERVDDLEAARRALRYQRIDLLSESAGTRTAMVYSWRYPKSINRSVMIGANPPGHFVYNPKTTDEQLRHYAALCAHDAACHKRTGDLVATFRTTHVPDRWGFLPIKKGNVRIASFFGLMDSTSAADPISGPSTVNSWIAASKGDPSGFWLQSTLAAMTFPESFVWGDVAAVGRSDARAAERYFASPTARGSILGNPSSDFLWGGGRLTGSWPANPDENEYGSVQNSSVPTLVIGGSVDFDTPPQNATKELLPDLPNGHQVVLPGLGHTSDFWAYQPPASSRLINTYLDSGRVDESLYKFRPVDFSPASSQTKIAKIILASLVGLGALAALSLLWLPLRVHRRGGFGRKGSASLRSLYPIVLGLGGWFLGVLTVLTASLRVPLDDQLLALISIALPIGLGIYWGWVHSAWSPRRKTAGFAGAVAGALIGGLLGFHATAGILAVVTTIVGATAGANLILLVLDIARDRTADELAVATTSRPALTGAGA
jgi:pimeloyl-ACP methyl ester carboxylesterase